MKKPQINADGRRSKRQDFDALQLQMSAMLKLLGESSRHKALAERAALRALIGPPEKRQEEEQLARQHVIRSETFKHAASLLQPTTDDKSSTINSHPSTLCKP